MVFQKRVLAYSVRCDVVAAMMDGLIPMWSVILFVVAAVIILAYFALGKLPLVDYLVILPPRCTICDAEEVVGETEAGNPACLEHRYRKLKSIK